MLDRFSRRDLFRFALVAGAASFPVAVRPPIASASAFDAADYGVIADGARHNNVANLLDCVAQAALAGASVLLPPGVIDTSEAVADTLVTADSGRTYRNNGGVPLPASQPMTISGRGESVTVLRLSPGFPRAFDFWWTAESQRYTAITIRHLTVDRNNLDGLAIAPRRSIAAWTSLPRGSWTTLAGVEASDFRNARLVWFSAENLGSARGIAMAARVVSGQVQVRNDSDSTDHHLFPGDYVEGALRDHVIVGTLQFGGTVPHGWDMAIDQLRIQNVESINVSTQTANGLSASKSDTSPNIFVNVKKSARTEAPIITNCVIANVRMSGGETGVCVSGAAGSFIDECWFIDCFHDTMVDPPSNYVSANFMIGQDAWVGRAGITRCHGRRSGDVACEVDQPWEAFEVDCVWEDAYNGVYSTSFVPPARTAAGPPTTTLAADLDGDGAGTETMVAVDDIPADAPPSGVLQIDDELFWYRKTPDGGRIMSVLRGFNGTKPETHSAGARVVFVQTAETRFTSLRSTIRNGVVMAAAGGGRAFLQYERNKLPLPPRSIRGATIEIRGGGFQPGQGVYWVGWQADLSVEDMRYMQTGITGAPDSRGSVVSWSSKFAQRSIRNIFAEPPRVKGSRNWVRVEGVQGLDSNFVPVSPGDDYARLDLVVTAEVSLLPAT